VIHAAKCLLTALVAARVAARGRRVVGSGAGILLPGVGVDSGKVAGDARAGVSGNTRGL
jgi:orotidine-5'-phosphate decarboxylase